MTVHLLDCATMHPRGAKLLGGNGGLLEAATMTTRCLLVEGRDGLVLVDTGLGLEDIAQPVRRLGRLFVTAVRPALEPAETALRQVEALGYAASEVRHIVVSHLDVDHAGGLADFPQAQVHLFRAELEQALRPRLAQRHRYRQAQWAHGPRWVPHDRGGERWGPFEGCRPLEGLEPEIALVPLPGHSAGHAAVAVRTEPGWLLYCGDGYFDRREIDPGGGEAPLGLVLFQRMLVVDEQRRVQSQKRLRELAIEREDVMVLCAHDAAETASALGERLERHGVRWRK